MTTHRKSQKSTCSVSEVSVIIGSMNVERVAQSAVDNTLVRIRDLKSETASPIHKQHLVSRTLLERFTEPGRGGRGLYAFDMEKPDGKHPDHKGVKGVGFERDFVAYASGSLEQLWNDTEQCLPPVFAAVDAGTALDDPANIAVLRDLLALHLTRSRTYLDLHKQSFKRAYQSMIGRLNGDLREEVRGAVLRERGLHIVGPGAIDYFANQFLAPSKELFQSDALLRVHIENIYDMARHRVSNAGLQIVTPQDGSEFVIGDTPAFTRGVGPNGPAVNVPLGVASTAILPIGPRHLLALSRRNETIAVPSSAVMEMNILQVLIARRHVFLRPGSGLEALVRGICYRKQALDRTQVGEQPADNQVPTMGTGTE